MAKLLNLFARPRGGIVRQSLSGLLALLAFVLLQFGATQWAQAQQVGADFDHASTGYVLNAQHQNVRCETCHLKGVFKGTPKDCESCHGWNNPRATFSVMPVNHIPTGNATCESCHQANMAQFMDATRMFNHAAVRSLTCVNCHSSNNPHPNVRTNPNDATHQAVMAQGQACDRCHTTIVFTGPKIPTTHIPIAAVACTACHKSTDYKLMPSVTDIHTNAMPGVPCAQCHRDATTYPMTPPIVALTGNHIPVAASAGCEKCHDPAGSFSTMPSITVIHANAQSTSSNCQQCHSSANAAKFTSAFMAPPLVGPPGDLVHRNPGACESCHVGIGSSITSTPVVDGDKFAGSLFGHSGIATGCVNCHGASVSASDFGGFLPKTISSLTPVHVPNPANLACETCHTNSVPSMLIPLSGASGSMTTFAGGQFSHSGITSGCDTCHGPDINRSSFFGISNLIVMPATSPAVATSHLPTGTTCEACHAGSTPSSLVPANATRNVGNSGFQLPAPTAAMIHAGITGNCSSCHDTNYDWLGMNLPVYAHTTAAPFTGFQTRPQIASGNHFVADSRHPNIGDCSQCHGSFANFNGSSLPANHIPYSSSATCSACHGDFSAPPTVGDIHANLQSASTNCAQCHSAANAALYANTTTIHPIVTQNSVVNHIPMGGLGCETCHVGSNSSIASTPVGNGAKFSGSAFSHAGTSTGCGTCHGNNVAAGTFFGVSPKTTASLTPAHVPASAACETCHVNSVPSMLIPANGAIAGMTTFSGAQFSHAGITSGCATCHGPNITGSSFFGISNVIVMPSTSPAVATSHLPTGTTCETCHAGSTPSSLVPANATRSVGNSGFQLPAPTAAMIHTGVTGNCSSCHDTNYDWLGMNLPVYANTTSAPYKGFQTRPQSASGNHFVADSGHQVGSLATGDCSQCHGDFVNFNGPSQPANHIPYASGATCAACHGDFSATPTVGAIHANLQSASTNCAQCHSAANAALYATTTTVNPLVTQNSVANHISMGGLSCESCHVGSNSSIQSTPVANGAKFSGSAFSHSGIASGCANCHGASVNSSTFYGVVPKTLAGLIPQHVPNPANLACETCHVNSVPSMQIPAAGATSGMTTFANAKFSHSGITTGCASCHGDAINGNSFYGINKIVVIPQMGIPGTGSHLPTAATCESCHAGSTPSALVAGNATANAPGTAFQLPVPTSTMIHNGITGSCSSCHDTNYVWMGMDKYPITTSAPYKGFQTRPQATSGTFFVADASHPPGECSTCHSGFVNFNGPSAPSNHIPYASSATCSACHGDFSSLPTVAKIHANIQSTSGNCAQCHSVANSAVYSANMMQTIKTVPAQHIPMGTATCESCHVGANSSIASTPVQDGALFSGSLFNHTGSNVSCATCHGSTVTPTTFTGVYPKTISNLSPGHVPSTAACETCHVNSVPTGLVPSTGMTTFAGGQFSHTGITTGCNACHGSGISGSTFYGISSIVVLPQTSPAGTGSHIPAPNNASCESCHAANTPSVRIAGNAVNTSPGTTGFFSPAPTNIQIHSGVTGNCVSCHETTMTWMGMSKYPQSPAVKTTGANYTGFNTRPSTAGGGNSIQDASHDQGDLKTQDCSQCHSGFGYFGAPVAPANHIPYKAGVACGVCHTSFAVAPDAKGSSTIHNSFQSSTANCVQCHSVGNSALYANTTTAHPIVAPSAAHVPMNGLSCELCHVASNTTGTFTSFANGSFSHSGLTTGCSTCHGINVDSTTFDGLPNIVATGTLTPIHIPVSNNISCETCHVNSIPPGLVPASGYSGSPKFSGAKFTHSGITTNCEQCHGPASSGVPYAGISVSAISRIPPFSPAGSGSHLPTSVVCANCHVASIPAGLVNGIYTGTTPTGFRLPAPSSAMVHSGVTSGCSSCHDQSVGWIGMDLYPRSPAAFVPNAPNTQYKGFQTRPQNSATGYSVANAAHQTGNLQTADCSLCHGSFVYFGQPTLPPGHIPYASAAACTSCHVNWGVAPTNAAIHANIQSKVGNCAQCHSTANAALYASTISNPGGIKAPSTSAPLHIPMRNLGCETCHTASNTMTTWTSFASGQFSHSGMTTNCAECHANGVAAFEGNPSIVKMPATTPSNTGAAHLPTSTVCESCHLGSMPSGVIPGSGSGIGFRTPVPTAAMIHAGVSTCSSCHEKDMLWLSMNQYPITTSAPFKGFQTRPYGAPTNPTYTINDAAHPPGGDCGSCHTGFTEWQAQVKPSNHIPTANVACANCHVASGGTTNYSTMPTLLATHTYAPSTTTNCAQCHSAANAALYNTATMTIKAPDSTHIPMAGLGCEGCHVGTNSSIAATPVGNAAVFSNSAFSHTGSSTVCATCHGSSVTTSTFQGGQIPKTMAGLTPAHVPNPAALGCEACHQTVPTVLVRLGTATTTFANGKFSHTGITSNCAQCHGAGITGSSFFGITRIVALTNYATTSGTGNTSHIPAANNGTCEACHLGNTPSGLFAANATAGAVAWNGASAFYTPAPTTTQIHSGLGSSGCVTCHEAGKTWSGMAKYPRTPSVLTANATYTGFHGRPVTGGAVNSIADANHPTTGDCSSCHGSTTSFSVSAMPSNHIPIGATAACTACHTNITATNKDFSVRPTNANIHAFGPATTISNCGQCHTTANATKYSIPAIPYTVVGAASNHVPYGSTNCTVCHTAAATTNYTSFANGLFSHSGITTGCATCHASTVTGFQGITANQLVVAANNSGQGALNHIPFTAACEVCHAVAGSVAAVNMAIPATKPAYTATGFRTPLPTGVMIHTGITNNCQVCHEKNYLWVGVSSYPISPTAVTANASYRGFQTRPYATQTTYSVADAGHEATGMGVGTDCAACHSGTTAFTGQGKPAGHMPTTTTSCAACHAGGDYSVVGLGIPGNLTTMHTNFQVAATAIVKATTANMASPTCSKCHSTSAAFAGCATSTACSSPPPTNWQASNTNKHPVHVPIGTTAALTVDCNGCHASVTSFAGVNMKNATMHTSVNGTAKVLCMSCHERGLAFYGVTNLKVRPNGHHTGQDCAGSGCHTYNGGFRALVKPVMRDALVSPSMSRIKPTTQTGKPTRGSLGNSFDHKGVAAGKCKDCHDGKSASGMPARHLMVATSCDTCHRPTTWLPAQFNHNGITPNTCLACHNGLRASNKPSGHFMTARSCDSCHKNMTWTPVNYQHLSPLYQASPDKLTCVSCHDTNGEIIRRQARALTRTKPIPVGH